MSGFVAMSAATAIPPLAFPTMIIILGHLGYEFVRSISEIRGVAKARAQAGVFRSANGVEVELTLTEEGNLELCVDEEQLRAMEGIEKEELTGKIVQGYTHHKVIEELEAQGYTVVEEEELDTGTIRLVVRKWS